MIRRKVCILTTVHPPFDTRIFHKQAKTLAEAGYDVTLIAQHKRPEIIDGIRILPLPTPKNRLQRMIYTTFYAFKLSLKERADVYHLHDPELLPIGLVLKLLTNGKVIYDVHEVVPATILTKDWIPCLMRKPMSWLFNFFERITTKFIDKLIAAADSIAARFPSDKVVTVRNYPRIDFFIDTIDIVHNSSKDYCTLIYVGGLTEERGIYELVKSLEFVDSKLPLRLKLIGKFYPPAFESRLRSLRAFAKVDYLGWLPYEEAMAHLKNADIGIVLFHPAPNHLGSCPNKLFEYMATGLPVVASNFPLWREIVEGNSCGICVDPLDPKAIAQAIEYLLAHPEEARRMGENGRRAVVEKYNWNMEGKKLLKLYEELLRR